MDIIKRYTRSKTKVKEDEKLSEYQSDYVDDKDLERIMNMIIRKTRETTKPRRNAKRDETVSEDDRDYDYEKKKKIRHNKLKARGKGGDPEDDSDRDSSGDRKRGEGKKDDIPKEYGREKTIKKTQRMEKG